ncbi:hypothetical protein AB0N73_09160 [Microbacterium sp. NPDC089189]|uniref:hypothetical protein n=1 Tax=Microbacterium sp. NPDC089189 TaxID=3154972 RepID=UPI00344A7FCE
MTRLGSRLLMATTLAAGTLLLVTACAGSTEPAEPSAAAPVPTATIPETPVATSTPTPDAVTDVTCDSLLSQSVIDEFASHKWTAKEDVFRIGDLTIDEGIQCVWGDYTVPSDHVQVFGWAPISDSEADAARTSLIASGWSVVSGTSGAYITENSDTAVARDDEGYGMTYEFGDGWVTLADTKQSLLLIERPAS